jgi:Xaa-Pro aminopeptidase
VDLNQIQSYLQAAELDGWLLYDFRGQNPIALHVAGLAGSGSRRWFLWIPARGMPAFLLHAIEFSTFVATDAALGDDKRSYVGWQELMAKLPQLLGVTDRRPRIAMEYSPQGAVPYVSKLDAGTKELIEAATSAEIVSSADLVQFAQATLTLDQQASHRRAAVACMAAKDAAFAFIGERLRRESMVTEYEVQQLIMAEFAARNLDPDHPPIVAVNANAADPHYAPSAGRTTPIQPGDMVLIDLWARERNSPSDCFADITWTAYCGSEAPPEAERIFQVVRQARDQAVAFIDAQFAAGETVYGFEVDDACRTVIEEAGFGEHFIHRTGHSLGSDVHFTGVNIDNLETQDRRALIPGVMFTIEPGIYQPAFNFDESEVAKGLGIRSEINCVVHTGRLEVTTLPLQEEIVCLL